MNAKEQAEKNILIDVLFDQIEGLDKHVKELANTAIEEWRMAKYASVGVSMEYLDSYKSAYNTLKDLGLEVGGMIKPDPDNRGMLYH